MAVVNQLNLNVGTEQNPNFVLHDINDKRISTTAVTTATHILTCNSGVTSIAPITAANLASVLGGKYRDLASNTNLNNIRECGFYCAGSKSKAESLVNMPSGFTPTAGLVVIVVSGYTNNSSEETRKSYCTQFLIYKKQVFIREYTTGTWSTLSTMI